MLRECNDDIAAIASTRHLLDNPCSGGFPIGDRQTNLITVWTREGIDGRLIVNLCLGDTIP